MMLENTCEKKDRRSSSNMGGSGGGVNPLHEDTSPNLV